jgi:hypothetical protein
MIHRAADPRCVVGQGKLSIGMTCQIVGSVITMIEDSRIFDKLFIDIEPCLGR